MLIISSIYVFIYRYDIYQMTELNAQNLIFILWLVLLGLPLFSEIEIGSVKLKKEIEQTRAEVKESIGELKYQILELKVNNTNSNMLVFSNQPLPSKDELSQLQQHIEHDNSIRSSDNSDFKISEDNIYLFQVRLSLEKQLSALCNFFNYGERRSIPAMAQFLVQHEVFDRKTAELIREVINIANRGVHGEIIDDDYVRFVKNTYPAIKKHWRTSIIFIQIIGTILNVRGVNTLAQVSIGTSAQSVALFRTMIKEKYGEYRTRYSP